MSRMSRADYERILAEIAADAGQLADLMADRPPLALRQWLVDHAVARADALTPNADGRDEIVERLRAAVLHPAAAENLDTAVALFGSDVPRDTAVRALDALAGSVGGKTAN